jgi:hypothetical protein
VICHKHLQTLFFACPDFPFVDDGTPWAGLFCFGAFALDLSWAVELN